jgi:BTB/POZ domain
MSSESQDIHTTISPPSSRPTCFGDPDVTVVVGGKKFQEHSKFLCCWSGYFDAAFRSGMKETSTKHFEFSDRDPDEWDWIWSLLVPFASLTLTLDKLDAALSWFDFLCVTRGLEQCDQVLHDAVLQVPLRCAEGFSQYLESLSTALQSKTQYFQLVRAVFNRAPYYLHQEHLDTMALLILSHEECRKELWNLLEKYLPAPIEDKTQQDCLLHTGALQSLVLTEIHKNHLHRELSEKKLQVLSMEHQMDALEERAEATNQQLKSTKRRLDTKNTQLRRIVAVMEQSSASQTVSQLKRQLKSDSICGHALPMRWARRNEDTIAPPDRKKRKKRHTFLEEATCSDMDDMSVLFGMSSAESDMED